MRFRSENVRRQTIFKVENTDEFTLVDQWQTENGSRTSLNDIGISRERILRHRILENHVLPGAHHVAHDGLRQVGGAGGGSFLLNRDIVSAGRAPCFNQELLTQRADQKTSFCAGMLHGRTQDAFKQLLRSHLAGDCLR